MKKHLFILASQILFFSQAISAQNLPSHIRVKIVSKDNQNSEIKVIKFDDYVAGVISKEMPLSWPVEALKAQAVVARNFALFRMNQSQNKNYDLRSDFWDQVFEPTLDERAHSAARATHNIALEDGDGKIIQTFFHADCGGQTVPAWSVWPGSKSFGVAEDIYCKDRNSSKWSFSVKRSEILKEESSDRVNAQKFKSKWVSFSGKTFQEIRKMFGFNLIRSNPDQIVFDDEKILFAGNGYGHGVGLCQWGARELAKRQKDFRQILTHYYPKANIVDNSPQLARQ